MASSRISLTISSIPSSFISPCAFVTRMILRLYFSFLQYFLIISMARTTADIATLRVRLANENEAEMAGNRGWYHHRSPCRWVSSGRASDEDLASESLSKTVSQTCPAAATKQSRHTVQWAAILKCVQSCCPGRVGCRCLEIRQFSVKQEVQPVALTIGPQSNHADSSGLSTSGHLERQKPFSHLRNGDRRGTILIL